MLKRIQQVIFTAVDKTGSVVKGVEGRLGRLGTFAKGLGGIITGVIGAAAVQMGITWSKNFAEAEKAGLRLESVLRNTGRAGDDAAKKIEEQAARIQRATMTEGDALVDATAALAELMKGLSGDELVKGQEAIVGIADTFFNGDVQNAGLQIAKSVEGSVNSLSRYGIQLDKTKSKEEQWQQLLEQAAPLYQRSVDMANGLEGASIQLTNAFGDLSESLGGIIVESLSVESNMRNTAGAVDSVAEKIENNRETIIRWGRIAVETVKVVMRIFWMLGRTAFHLGESIGHALGWMWEEVVESAFKAWNQLANLTNKSIDVINVVRGLQGKRAITFRLGELDSSGAEERSALRLQMMKKAVLDIGDAWNDAGQAVADYVVALEMMDGKSRTRVGGRTSRSDQSDTADDPAAAVNAALDKEIEKRMKGAGVMPILAGTGFDQLTGLQTRDINATDLAAEPIAAIADETINFWHSVGENIREAYGELESFDSLLGSITSNTLGAFAQAAGDAFGAMISGSEDAGAAFESAMLQALAGVAQHFGEYFLGHASAALGAALLGNPSGLASAAKYTAAAGIMFGISGAARSAASNAGGGAGNRASAERETNRFAGSADNEATLILEGDVLDMSNPKNEQKLARALTKLTGRRVRIDRRGRGR